MSKSLPRTRPGMNINAYYDNRCQDSETRRDFAGVLARNLSKH